MESGSTKNRVRLRAAVSLIVGAVAGVLVAVWDSPAVGAVAGWGVMGLINVVWVLRTIWPMNAAETKVHAIEQDPGRSLTDTIAVVASLVSLGAVVLVIAQSQESQHVWHEYLLAGIAVLSVATSWAQIQIDYMLRYARVYYSDPEGGITFNQAEPPEYTDFIYFGIGLGMTYQVADTNVTTNAIRRIVIGHTVLAFLFATVILATIVNLVTSIH